MRKLLVLLVALVTVAAFGAVSITGRFFVTPKLTYDASANTFSVAVEPFATLDMRSSDSATMTGFVVTFERNFPGTAPASDVNMQIDLNWGTYVWQKLYVSDAFTVTLQVGKLSRGYTLATGSNFSWIVTPPSFTSRNRTDAVALKFDIASGELKDSLTVYAYTPAATSIDVDVYNSLSFSFLGLTLLAKGIVSAGAGKFPEISAGATIDLAKALEIKNATLKGFGYVALDAGAGTLTGMLKDYLFGVDFGIEKFKGSFVFAKGNELGIALVTTALSPVTLGADFILPNITDLTKLNFVGYASWKTELLSHTVSASYEGSKVTVGWSLGVSF
ncbi:hypothetical protein [Pseudothermotoga sp.]|nr:hypothetical protein [Pseudothermotoga sp.]MDW8140292.1 hypothetical protein [Pseudothermotoga sp.]